MGPRVIFILEQQQQQLVRFGSLNSSTFRNNIYVEGRKVKERSNIHRQFCIRITFSICIPQLPGPHFLSAMATALICGGFDGEERKINFWDIFSVFI